MASRLWICTFGFILSLIARLSASETEYTSASETEDSESKEFVLSLDHSNFSRRKVSLSLSLSLSRQKGTKSSYKTNKAPATQREIVRKRRGFLERESLAAMASTVVFILSLIAGTSASETESTSASETDDSESKEFVLNLDHSNFHETVGKHDFIVVVFYAPWCGHCKKLAPEYEKAASVLSSHDPPVTLAKVDASDETNKGLAGEFEISGFSTIKILRNGGKHIQEYKGPRDAEGIVAYLKKQSGPSSAEIKSTKDANTLIDGKKIIVE